MNKTVNINLAGTSFHIDEDAFGKLSRYLEAVKRSLVGADGSDEIMQDIEARIAELFSEKLENSAQVITLKELDEVIAVMGQPEDYQVDDEIFDDAPHTSRSRSKAPHKQLFRDIDNKYIGGVSSGLGHYLGIDAIWIRLLWILLVLAGMGSPILIYILLWILVPAAESTSDKLKMTGEPINISNIEKKFKEGFDTVTDKVKNADYDKYGEKVKRGASGFFDSLGNVILGLFKVFGKFIGVIMILVSLLTLIGLVIGFFTFGSIGFWGNGEITEYITLVDTTNVPMWLLALLGLFAVGIPFFALFIVGLKLLINNLKSMGTSVKIVLVVVWVVSVICLSVLGIKQATEQAYEGNFIIEKTISVPTNDTLHIAMRADNQYELSVYRSNGMEIKYNAKKERVIYSNDIRLNIKSTKDSIGKIIIEKRAEGNSFLDAKNRAEMIDYQFSIENNKLLFDGFLTTDPENKFRDQEIEITLLVPEGTIIYTDENIASFYRNNSSYDEYIYWKGEAHYIKVLKNNNECLDCETEEVDSLMDDETKINLKIETESWEVELNNAQNEENIEEVQETIETQIEETDTLNIDLEHS